MIMLDFELEGLKMVGTTAKPIQIQIPLSYSLYKAEEQILIVLPNLELVTKLREILSDVDLQNARVVVKPIQDLNKMFEGDDFKEVIKAFKKEYSLILVDKAVNSKLRKFLSHGDKKKFIQSASSVFPLKLSRNNSELESNSAALIEDSLMCSVALLNVKGNRRVKVCQVGQSVKESVKNVLRTVYMLLPFLIYYEGEKDFKIGQISLKTKQSIKLPIYEGVKIEEIDQD